MKLITAIIRAEKLDEVRQALIAAEITRITVTRCSGRGQAERVDKFGEDKAHNTVARSLRD